MMITGQRGRGSKYTDDFKRKLVAESSADGVSVPMVAKKHGVPENRIYSWRGDPRFQPDEVEVTAFTPVEIADADIVDTRKALRHCHQCRRLNVRETCMYHPCIQTAWDESR